MNQKGHIKKNSLSTKEIKKRMPLWWSPTSKEDEEKWACILLTLVYLLNPIVKHGL
jgi:hypothetical protein